MSTLWSTDVDCYDSVLSYILDINSDVYWVRRFYHCFKTSRGFGLLEFINDNCERYKNLLQMLSRKKNFSCYNPLILLPTISSFWYKSPVKKDMPIFLFLSAIKFDINTQGLTTELLWVHDTLYSILRELFC